MRELIITQLAPFAIALTLGLLTIPKMRLTSRNGALFLGARGLWDPVEGIEIAGAALYPILLISLCITMALPGMLGMTETGAEIGQATMRILQIITGGGLLYLTGLKDDLHGTELRTRFAALFLAAAIFPATGLWIDNLNGLFGIEGIPAWIGMPLTVLVGMYLNVTMMTIDSTDGLSSGLSCVLMTAFLSFCIAGHFTLGALVAAAALGVSCSFFLTKVSEKGWRKTMMGNSGTLLLGYIISYLTIGLCRQGGTRLPVGMIMICLGIVAVPAFDMLRVIRSRVREGRGILTLDRNQIQHRLLRAGMGRVGIPVTITLLVLGFTLLNTLWVVAGHDLTVLLAVDIALWWLVQLGISERIRHHEAKAHREAWDKEYGREAWEADVPHETMRLKQEIYGDMGLPEYMVQDKETVFIPDGMTVFERGVKRLLDMVFSGASLVLFSPLFLLCYVLIRLDDGGPAIYRQVRIGRFGKPFRIYKFRSMRTDAEKSGPMLSPTGGSDPRLTRTGRFLRSHHLDELPQLWNVFKGDMAFIGYRPERPFFIERIMKVDPRYAFLYQIRPGVTSYATLYNGYTDTMEKMLRRLELDLYYLGHRSWLLDIKVLALTFLNIIFGKKF